MENLTVFYLAPFIILSITLFLVGVINMGFNVRYAIKDGNFIYISIVLLVTIVVWGIGWILGGLID